jgi:glycosyltransferase involved in cell wall biosynthesis
MAIGPFISIIIPVRNAARTLPTTFNYLFKIDYPRESMEIVVADGGSTDDTVKVIKEWQKKYAFIKLVEVPNCPSPGFARNKALDAVKGEFLFFTDGDCAPATDWIWQIIKIFQRDEKIAAVGGELYTLRVDKNNLVEAWCEHFRFNMVAPRYGFIKEGLFPDFPKDPSPIDIAGHKAFFFGTCNVAYRRSAMKEIGARFWDRPTGEDMDLSYQHRSKGSKFYFAPQAKIDHMHQADLKSLKKVWVMYGAAHIPLIDKYVKRKSLDIVLQFIKGNPIIRLPFLMRGFVYIGNFHLMHLFALLALIGTIVSLVSMDPVATSLTFLSFALTLYFGFQYVKWNFDMEPKDKFWAWCKMKYLTNFSFIKGGLKGFWKYKILCIEPSF